MGKGNTKILSIGTELEHPSVLSVEFKSTQSLLDCDILIIDPNHFVREYFDYSERDRTDFTGFQPIFVKNDSSRLLADAQRRSEEIADLLKRGRTIIVHTPVPQQCFYPLVQPSTSRSEFGEFFPLSIFPISGLQTSVASGVDIDFRGAEPFTKFWETNRAQFSCRSYFNQPIGIPLWFVKGTDKVIGCHIDVHAGHLIFMPPVPVRQHLDSKDWRKAQAAFVDSLLSLVRELKGTPGEPSLPEWSNAYMLHEERERKDAVQKLRMKATEIESEIEFNSKRLGTLADFKLLFTGTGKVLEIQVKRVFEELGVIVKEDDPGRDDLIIEHLDRVAAMEIKGVGKSAAEKQAAQLEKWVAEYYTAHGINPKGILVINAFKDTPLSSRKEPAFPNQMLNYSQNRGHCLITGLQLLGLYLDCIEHPEKKDELIGRLFSTVGVFDGYQNWQDFLVSNAQEPQVAANR